LRITRQRAGKDGLTIIDEKKNSQQDYHNVTMLHKRLEGPKGKKVTQRKK